MKPRELGHYGDSGKVSFALDVGAGCGEIELELLLVVADAAAPAVELAFDHEYPRLRGGRRRPNENPAHSIDRPQLATTNEPR